MRVFITGSADGLGLNAARDLLDQGHQVVLHARSAERAAVFDTLSGGVLGVVIGDLSSAVETRSIADQVNQIGQMDAIIHNGGIYLERYRGETPEGHSKTLAVNVLAPYLLTNLIDRPSRLIYLTSGMHLSGRASLDDVDWKTRSWSPSQAYSESKLYVATIAAAVARRWPEVLSNSVNPGWVPTKMGGSGAPDDLAMGHQTQAWLAVSEDDAAKVSGHYWFHKQQRPPAPAVIDPDFQDRLIDKLSEMTGTRLFS
jgi:NAD(P)-dependent dehydrogenase (short-subunit alcohol dehydrogenase family)